MKVQKKGMNIIMKKITIFLLLLFCCASCVEQPTPPSVEWPPSPTHIITPDIALPANSQSEVTEPFFWLQPSSEMFGFDGVYAQLYDIIVDYFQDTNAAEKCTIPEVQIFAIDEANGAYYCFITFTSFYYQENDPAVLDVGSGGSTYKIDTVMEGGILEVTGVNELRLDGLYDYTKEQLEKIPGLFEAYQNKNSEPMEIYWNTPAKEELVQEYFKQTGYHFTHVLSSGEQVEDFSEWIDTE